MSGFPYQVRHIGATCNIFSFTDVYKDATLKDLLRDDNFAVVVHHLSREGIKSLFFEIAIINIGRFTHL